MRKLLSLMSLSFKILTVCVCAAFFRGASAQTFDNATLLPSVTPFKPTLTVDKDPQLCAQFKAAWTEVYENPTALSETVVDLKSAITEVQFLEPPEGKSFVGYYSAASAPVDFDNDGDEEIFYAESHHSRGLYTGTSYYLYESREDFDAQAPGEMLNGKVIPAPRFRYRSFDGTKAKLLGGHHKVQAGFIFKKDGRLIAQSGNVQAMGKVSLDHLQIGKDPDPICTLNLRGEIVAPALYDPLMQIYAGPEQGYACYGTMGWTAEPPYKHLSTLYHRPQAMQPSRRDKRRSPEDNDALREYRYIGWGLSDPSSFDIIRDLKDSYPKFISQMTLYYHIMHDMDEAAAKAAAELGYRYLLDKIFYARSNGLSFNVNADTQIGPQTQLKTIVEMAVLSSIENEEPNLSALKLGLLAGTHDASLIKLSALVETYVYRNSEQKIWTDAVANDLLLMSLSRPALMTYFIDKGADLNAKTNYFGKTPLMYAAQNNNLAAVKLLIDAGADPNTKTLSEEGVCQTKLTRDHRTALMYAAENADSALIVVLLEGGANPIDVDSQGNSPLWYLESNTRLSARQKENLRPIFLSE